MRSFWAVMLLMFICGNLSSQNPVNRAKTRVHSLLDGAFRNSKITSHNPLATTSPYFKVTRVEKVRYQLDSLILTPAVNGSGTPKAKIECKYDSLGRMILFYSSQSNDSTMVVEFSYKYVYSYGSNYSIKDWYEAKNGTASFYSRTKTIYDQNSRIQSVIEGADTVNFTTNSTRNEYVYENNLLSTINSFSPSSITPDNITRYYYDALNRDTAEVTFNNYYTLTAIQKKTYSYNANNDITHSEILAYSNANWNPESKSDYSYNNSHDCISYTEETFSNNVSYGQFKYISSYNKSIMMSDVNYGYTFTDFPYSFKSQLENIDLYLLNGSVSLPMGNYTFYYSISKESTGITNTIQDNNQLVKYNVASKTITLQNTEFGNSNQLQLYSSSGKLMLNKPISTSGSVSVDKLSNGLYVYKLIIAGKTVAGKILIQ